MNRFPEAGIRAKGNVNRNIIKNNIVFFRGFGEKVNLNQNSDLE